MKRHSGRQLREICQKSDQKSVFSRMFASARVAPCEFVGNTTPLVIAIASRLRHLSKLDARATNFFIAPRKIRTSSERNVAALKKRRNISAFACLLRQPVLYYHRVSLELPSKTNVEWKTCKRRDNSNRRCYARAPSLLSLSADEEARWAHSERVIDKSDWRILPVRSFTHSTPPCWRLSRAAEFHKDSLWLASTHFRFECVIESLIVHASERVKFTFTHSLTCWFSRWNAYSYTIRNTVFRRNISSQLQRFFLKKWKGTKEKRTFAWQIGMY